jgi:uncharacterized membrane protein YgdD (TMEM256/DUF423 family)
MKASTIIAFAGLNGFIATTLAAMGSHMLPIVEADAGLFKTAYIFHYIHTFALIGCAALVRWAGEDGTPLRWGGRAAIFFLTGIMCFSVSLYWRAVMGPGSLGSYHWITPLGGLALMGGWLTFTWGGLKVGRKSS